MFVYYDLVQNKILGATQIALLTAVPVKRKRIQQTSNKPEWRRDMKASSHSLTISVRSETSDPIPFFSRGRTNLTLQFKQVKHLQQNGGSPGIIIYIHRCAASFTFSDVTEAVVRSTFY